VFCKKTADVFVFVGSVHNSTLSGDDKRASICYRHQHEVTENNYCLWKNTT